MDSPEKYERLLDYHGPRKLYMYVYTSNKWPLSPEQTASLFTVAAVAADLEHAPLAAESIRERIRELHIPQKDIDFLLGPYSSELYSRYNNLLYARSHSRPCRLRTILRNLRPRR